MMTERPLSQLKIAVLMGGWSAERAISLASGQAVYAALMACGYSVQAIDIHSPADVMALDQHYDCFFNVIHGTGGEDGTIQAILDLMGAPYSGTGVLGSALGMDKWRCKLIWRAIDLPVVPGLILDENHSALAAAELYGWPVFVKPSCEGSSIGVARATNISELEEAIENARKCHGEVLIEPAMTGGDYTVALIGDQALPAIRIEPATLFYDYAAKYEREDTRYLCPCALSDEEEKQLGQLALSAFRAIDGRDWGRVDFLRDRTSGDFLLAEVNTVPGMTNHSLVPMAARHAGIEFPDLVSRILSMALSRGDI